MSTQGLPGAISEQHTCQSMPEERTLTQTIAYAAVISLQSFCSVVFAVAKQLPPPLPNTSHLLRSYSGVTAKCCDSRTPCHKLEATTRRGGGEATQDHGLGIRENKAHIKKNPKTKLFLLRKTGNNYKIWGHTTAANVFVVPCHTHRNCSKVVVNCQHQHWGFSLHFSQCFRHFWVCLKKFRVFFILVVPKAFLCFHTVFLLPCLQLADPKSLCKCQKQSSKCLKRMVSFFLHFARKD